MRVSVFGLGYAGCVSAASFAGDGHEVVGVDLNADKVASINAGCSPIVEPGLEDLLGECVAEGRLRATTDTGDAIRSTDVSLLCVGTPSRKNGSLDLQYLERVSEEVGRVLKDKPGYHVVVVRSTVLPGTTHSVVIPALERESGKKYGDGFGVSVNPEFLREGTAVYDYFHPPKTVIGEVGQGAGDVLAKLYGHLPGPLIRTDYETAEMVKYADNTWHALKVGFANEIGNICKGLGLDSHKLMDIFCQDTKLNLSPYYLKPGFAFGGSCLPKDVRALSYKAKLMDVKVPIIDAILPSNDAQIERGIRAVIDKGSKKVGILGFSFKAGTDDLRESPIVILAEALLGKGVSLRIYDKNVSMAKLVGANKDYIVKQIPHLSSLLCNTIAEVIEGSDVIVVGNQAPEFSQAVMDCRADQIVIDLVRLPLCGSVVKADYRGICW